jgi:hypothetical protein
LSGLFSASQALQDCFGRLKLDGSTEDNNQNPSFEQFKKVIQIEKLIELVKNSGFCESIQTVSAYVYVYRDERCKLYLQLAVYRLISIISKYLLDLSRSVYHA